MAGGSDDLRIGFSTDIDETISQVARGFGDLERTLQQASNAADSSDVGGQIIASLEELPGRFREIGSQLQRGLAAGLETGDFGKGTFGKQFGVLGEEAERGVRKVLEALSPLQREVLGDDTIRLLAVRPLETLLEQIKQARNALKQQAEQSNSPFAGDLLGKLNQGQVTVTEKQLQRAIDSLLDTTKALPAYNQKTADAFGQAERAAEELARSTSYGAEELAALAGKGTRAGQQVAQAGEDIAEAGKKFKNVLSNDAVSLEQAVEAAKSGLTGVSRLKGLADAFVLPSFTDRKQDGTFAESPVFQFKKSKDEEGNVIGEVAERVTDPNALQKLAAVNPPGTLGPLTDDFFAQQRTSVDALGDYKENIKAGTARSKAESEAFQAEQTSLYDGYLRTQKEYYAEQKSLYDETLAFQQRNIRNEQLAAGDKIGVNLQNKEEGFKQLGGSFIKVPENFFPPEVPEELRGFARRLNEGGVRSLESTLELIQAQDQYRNTLRSEQKAFGASASDGIGKSFLGGAFGHGYEAQKFDPSKILPNLAGTAGVLLRYGGEGQLIYGLQTQLKDAVKDSVAFRDSLNELNIAQDATGSSGLNLASAISAGAQAGLSATDVLNVGTQALLTYGDAIRGGANANEVFNETVKAVAQGVVLTGGAAADVQKQLTAGTFGFQTGPQGQSRLLDAAVNATKNFGGTTKDALAGLATTAEAAGESGIAPEVVANLIQLASRNGGVSGAAAGGEIERLIQRGGTPKFAQTLATLGVSNTGDPIAEIEAASVAFNKLGKAQQAQTLSSLGGRNALGVLIPLLRDGTELTNGNARSFANGGEAARDYFRKIGDIAGQLRQLAADVKGFATAIGSSGLLAPLGLAVELFRPMLEAVNELLNQFNKVPAPIRDVVFTLAEAYVLLKNIAAIQAFTGGIFTKGKSKLSEGDGAGKTADTVATEENTAATDQNTAATNANTATTEENTAAAAERTVALDAETLATEASTAATDEQIATLDVLAEREAAQAALDAERTARRAADVAGIEAEIAAETGLTAARRAGAAAAGGQTILPTGVGRVGAVGAVGAAGNAVGNFFGGKAGLNLGTLLIAGLGAEIGVGLVKAGVGQQDARDKIFGAQANAGRAGDESSLRDAASALKQAAEDGKKASSGVFGTIFDVLSGGSTSRAAEEAKKNAEATSATADALSKARTDVADNNRNAASSIDFATPDTIKASITQLQNTGRDSRDIAEALIGKLNNIAQNAAVGGGALLPGQVPTFAAGVGDASSRQALTQAVTQRRNELEANQNSTKIADAVASVLGNDHPNINALVGTAPAVVDRLLKGVQDFVTRDPGTALSDVFGGGDGKAGSARDGTVKDLKKLDTSKIGKSVTDGVTAALNEDGFAGGGKIDPAELDKLKKIAEDAYRNDPNFKNLKKNVQKALLEGADKSVTDFTASLNLDPAHITKQNVHAAVAGIEAAAGTAGQEAGADATLAGGDGALAAAQASLSYLERGKAAAAANNANSVELTKLQDDINASLIAVAQQQVAAIDSAGALTAAKISPFDAAGKLAANRNRLESDLRTPNLDGRTQNQLNAQLADLNFQQAQQAVTDTNASIAQNTSSQDAAGRAADAMAAAANELNLVVSQGNTSGAAYSQKVTAYNTARQASIDAQIGQITSLAASQIDPQDTVGAAGQALDAVNLKLAKGNTTRIGKDGKQTALYSDLQKTQRQDARNYLTAQLDMSDAIQNAYVDSRDTVGEADLKVNQLGLRVETDDKNSPQYFKDLKAKNDAVIAAAVARANLANANEDAATRIGDPLAQAKTKVDDANRLFRTALPGTQGYAAALQNVRTSQAAFNDALLAAAQVALQLSIDTTDPVAEAKAALTAARAKLASDVKNKQGNVKQDKLDVEKAADAAQKASFQQQLSDNTTRYNLREESAKAYLTFLKGQDSSLRSQLKAMKVGTDGYRQKLDELNQIDSTIQGLNSQLQGQFNLGDIKLPTVYEVRRGVAAQKAGQSISSSSVQNIYTTINGADFKAVVTYLNGILGRTAQTSAVSGRK